MQEATITLVVHPWYGQRVFVLRPYGRRAVWIEREVGDRRVVPVSWTSLVPRVPCRLPDGRPVRLSPPSALELARWVSDRMQRTREAR